MYLFRTEDDDYDDYDNIGFADEELCSICKQPFIYVGHSSDDICLECDDSIDDYDNIGFADEELCSICKQPFIYVGHSSDDICLECDDSISDP